MSRASLRRLEVRLEKKQGDDRPVGTLAEAGGRIYFEYDAHFLADPVWLSPFKLPPQPGLIEHRDREFGPLFGLFDDSLPDGWGLLLMDRFFQQQGIRPSEVGLLERLAFLGRRTLGALTYHPPADSPEESKTALDLDTLAVASAEVLRGGASEVLPQLVRAGGSPGGARPKVLVGVRGEELISGESDLPPGFEPWLIKFPDEAKDRDAGPVEEAYARMARAAGIDLPPTRLFTTREGARYFGVKRFDRGPDGRLHVHTFGNLIHANFRLPSCDYRQLLEVTRVLTRRQRDVEQQLRRMIFNVLAHNRDDHAKNFAFLIDEIGEWTLTPAYDLNFAEGPGGEHTTTIAGEGKTVTRTHLLDLAEGAGVPEAAAAAMIEEVGSAVSAWPSISQQLEIAPAKRRTIGTRLDHCHNSLR